MIQRMEELSPAILLITVEISADRVDSLLDTAVHQYGEGLDGFRPGSAPAEVVEKRFAREVSLLAGQSMLDMLMASIIHEHGLCPVNRVAHDDCVLVRGQACSFTVHMEVVPPVLLPEKLEELAVKVQAPVVDSRAFYAALQRLRQARGKLLPVGEARTPEDGDVVFLDVQAACAGRPIPGLCAQNLALRLGGDESHPDICALARTLKAGSQGSALLPCPEKYPDQALHGREIQYTIHLKDVKKEVLPALDDAFAVLLGKKDVRALQEDVYKELLTQAIVRNQQEAEEELLGSLLDAQDFPLPPSLLAIHRKACTLQARAFLQRQGMEAEKLEQQLEEMGEERERVAQGLARTQAYLMALAYREKLVVSENELKQAIEKMARHTRSDAVKLEAELYASNAVYELQDQLLADKALRHLYTKAKKVVVHKERQGNARELGADEAQALHLASHEATNQGRNGSNGTGAGSG